MLIMQFECSFGKWGLGLSLCHLLCCGFVVLVSPLWLRGIHFINAKLEGQRCTSIVFIKTHRKDCACCVLTVDCHGRIYNIIFKKQELRICYVECWKYWWWNYIYSMVSILLFSLITKSYFFITCGKACHSRNCMHLFNLLMKMSYSIKKIFVWSWMIGTHIEITVHLRITRNCYAMFVL